jgi:hypothetical protein
VVTNQVLCTTDAHEDYWNLTAYDTQVYDLYAWIIPQQPVSITLNVLNTGLSYPVTRTSYEPFNIDLDYATGQNNLTFQVYNADGYPATYSIYVTKEVCYDDPLDHASGPIQPGEYPGLTACAVKNDSFILSGLNKSDIVFLQATYMYTTTQLCILNYQ